MSRGTILGKRYARALFEAARDRQLVTEVGRGLELAVSVLESDETLRQVWQHPELSSAEKKRLATEGFGPHIPELALNAILLMIDKGREQLLPDVAACYRDIANEAIGQERAVVFSPVPLTDEDRLQVAETFGKLTGKHIVIENIVKPELLGGIQVRIGDRLYDGSLSGKLQRLHKSLASQAM